MLCPDSTFCSLCTDCHQELSPTAELLLLLLLRLVVVLMARAAAATTAARPASAAAQRAWADIAFAQAVETRLLSRGTAHSTRRHGHVVDGHGLEGMVAHHLLSCRNSKSIEAGTVC